MERTGVAERKKLGKTLVDPSQLVVRNIPKLLF